MTFDNDAILDRYAGLIGFETISHVDPDKIDYGPFFALHDYLRQTYPLVHAHLSCEVVERASLLYHWKGDGSSPALPVALLAHLDVVPPGDLSLWKHPPFSLTREGGYVYGRGVLDNKCQLLAQMEAIEALLADKWAPPCDVYLCYGHNEEVLSAQSGARAIVELLRSRGVRLGLVIDEGGCVTDGTALGIAPRVAVIGMAEKGSADFLLTARDAGGHSSQPGPGTAVGRIARAAVAIEESPMPQRLLHAVSQTLTAAAPHMDKAASFLLSHQKTFWGPLKKVLAQKRATNAMTRTTTAVTMASGAAASNVLPELASVTVNCRILPGDTIESVRRHLQEVAGEGVEVQLLAGFEPSPESKQDETYELLARLAGELAPDTVVTPYLMMAGSDARHYYAISDHVYRFAPYYMDQKALPTAHSVNECLPEAGFDRADEFYAKLLRSYGAR